MERQQAYEYTGVVHRILPKEKFASGFEKRTVIVRDDREDGGRHKRFAAFDFLHGTGSASSDLTKLIEGFREGERVTVSFFTDAHESKNKPNTWFSANRAVRMERAAASAPIEIPVADAQPQEDGEMPF